jgi:hypothetical protein
VISGAESKISDWELPRLPPLRKCGPGCGGARSRGFPSGQEAQARLRGTAPGGGLSGKERTTLQREASRANGTKFGRPRKVADSEHITTARRMKVDGIAKYLGASRARLYRYFAEEVT